MLHRLKNIERLPASEMYTSFAYHIALLKQFDPAAVGQGSASHRKMNRSHSVAGEKGNNSVHGTKVFEKKTQPKMKRAASGTF